jgi:hypothetical protein
MGISCGACENLTAGIYLCHECTEKLERDLQDVPLTVESLWASAARLDVGNGSVGSCGHSEPTAPTNSRAYDAGRTLNIILTGWADTLGHRQPHAVKAAAVLLAHIREVRAAEWAPDLKRELREVLWQCDSITDRGGPQVFAGICPTEEDGMECGNPVYTPAGKTEDWRDRALAAAGPATATALELTRILSDPVRALIFPQNKIAVWVNRGKLTHVNEWDRWMAGILNQPIPAKQYQVRKVRNLWERSLIESAARSQRIMAARLAKQQTEMEDANSGRIAA